MRMGKKKNPQVSLGKGGLFPYLHPAAQHRIWDKLGVHLVFDKLFKINYNWKVNLTTDTNQNVSAVEK